MAEHSPPGPSDLVERLEELSSRWAAWDQFELGQKAPDPIPDGETAVAFAEAASHIRALLSALSAERARGQAMREGLERIRDQPAIGGGWFDWAKGIARTALSASPAPAQGEGR